MLEALVELERASSSLRRLATGRTAATSHLPRTEDYH